MNPGHTSYGSANRCVRDAENAGQPLCGRPLGSQPPYEANVGLRKPAALVLLSPCMIATVEPPLSRGVQHILRLAAYKEVTGANTLFVVAVVADVETGRDWAVVQFPGQPVRLYLLATTRKPHAGVPIRRLRPAPFPTARSLVDFRPESLSGILIVHSMIVPDRLRTRAASAVGHETPEKTP